MSDIHWIAAAMHADGAQGDGWGGSRSSVLRVFNPGWFGVVMGAGGVAVACAARRTSSSGIGRFVDPRTVAVGDRCFTASRSWW